jgi:hypothetical protein
VRPITIRRPAAADDVPVNLNVYPNLEAAREQAATALAAKILGHVRAGA